MEAGAAPAHQPQPPGPHQSQDDGLSVCTKLCYGIGGAPNQVATSAIAFYLQIYLLDIARISPYQSSLVLFLGKVSGAVADPLAGFFINKSKWTRIGRLMPWLLGCTPFTMISYFLLWNLPPFTTYRGLWYMAFYCSFQALATFFHVPYSALTMFLSPNQKERDSATAYRMTMEMLGTLIGATLQGLIVARVHVSHNCTDSLNSTSDTSLPLAVPPEANEVYMTAAGIIASTYLLCVSTLFFGVKEKDDPYALLAHHNLTFFKGIKLTLKHMPFVILVTAFLFISAAVQVEQSYFVLFCTHATKLHGHFQDLVLVILVSAVLSTPFWEWFLQKFGKKTAACGISCMVPFAVLLVIVPHLAVAYVVAFMSGVSISASLLLPWSMLPDVVDDFRVENLNIRRPETIFYSSYVFFTKLSGGFALGISTLSLEFSGYRSGACKQSQEVAVTLKVLIGAVPTLMILIGLSILMFYPITEERRRKSAQNLDLLRKNEREPENPNKSLEAVGVSHLVPQDPQ
ncbi:major facilitator superfamily domain-containing protein 2B [Tachyglossus aculeatus]|uniref:major facilitator superfamily domain-containing protein 2B n=1 Tax=Tachyglossus aculeatus TaxID=9261 RepID=UPI0018F44344|nr:major facilitator superfamily domain-containing protein 2B [Tachyglossus aculeatus]